MRNIVIIILIYHINSYFAFNQKDDVIQFSGIVVNDILQPLPFVHILIENRNKGTITDQNGLFSFLVRPQDTIRFSAVGFKTRYVYIPDTIQEAFFNIDIFMEPDTILIEEVYIYPWKTYEEFKQAFLELKLPEDDYQKAIRNIAIIKTQIILSDEPDPSINYKRVMNDQMNALMTSGEVPYLKLLSIKAWNDFIEAIQEGKFKDKNKEIREKYKD